jgi:amino acid adenylation domain-containing protein
MKLDGSSKMDALATHVSEREHQSLIVDYNDSTALYPANKTIVELFEAQVARTPNDKALQLGNRALSYGQLNEQANRVAALLCARGIGPGRLVALYMEHSFEVVSAILGVLKAGAAYVPVDPTSTPKERLGFILKDISEGTGAVRASPVLLTHSQLASKIPQNVARMAEVLTLDGDFAQIEQYPNSNPELAASSPDLAYVIYTSGSTGQPKGVLIEHRSLVNYIWWANQKYCRGERLTWPLFSSLAFDLTVTSVFTPLISGGCIMLYREDEAMRGMGILKVIEDGVVNIVKLTPSHLVMIKDMDLGATKIRKLIVGGDDLKTDLARDITRKFGRPVEIYNEYGPTEATVGCMIHRFDPESDRGLSVPIGVPANNTGIYILDDYFNPVPTGVIGEMYIAGDGLARGYLNQPELTAQKFLTVEDPRQRPAEQSPHFAPRSLRMYKTGDLARWGADGRMEFLGRADYQVKIGGIRIELGEIESCLTTHPDIRECVVDVTRSGRLVGPRELIYCVRCGVASNLPGTTYDAEGVCNICRAYDGYVDKAQAYFKTVDEFKVLVAEMKAARTGDYDCLLLFSGGKDSTYMLYKIKELGLNPLAFTLDNGFLSEEAINNIRRVTQTIGVDHVFGRTPHMNEIFVDSLKQFSNVCNGCFKTIYTLATNLAHEKGIRYIVTGLSRGQFFETRLTEEVFKRKDFDVGKLDALVLEARKAYHQRQDAVSCHLPVDILQGDGVFDEIHFVDFYRYWSVSLEEVYALLKERGVWSRPSDTGRSTNCLINDVGIYIHKKQRGFHNYSLPYSWDVRLKQKTRSEAMKELEDEIEEARVKEIMAQIGYDEPPAADGSGVDQLVAYYVSEKPLTVAEVRAHLAKDLPDYMIPPYVVWLEKLPLTPNGKIDRKALPSPAFAHKQPALNFAPPQTENEKALALIWTELLRVDNIAVDDEFFDLGGHSLLAIRAVSRIRDVFGINIGIQALFENPTIAGLASVLTVAKRSEAKTDQHQILVRVRPGTSARPPFFCAHGTGGNVLNLRPLAMALPADLPFYCLQEKGLDGSDPFETIEETARCYVDEIRQVQPHGPYYLGGTCYGGLSAFETACRLEELGEPVAALVLIDAFNPVFVRSLSGLERLFRIAQFVIRRAAWHARRMLTQRPGKWPGYISGLRKALRKHMRDPAEVTASVEAEMVEEAASTSFGENLKRVIHASFVAGSKYTPTPYAGSALIFRASARNLDPYDDYCLGWESVVRGGIECLEIEGDHMSILEEPAVRLIADKLNATLVGLSANTGEASALHVSARSRS